MRVSSIDVGSNAIRQIIVEIGPDGAWSILKRHRETIRLGTDVFTNGMIRQATQNRLIAAFKRMAKFNRAFKVNKSLTYATSAFRDAKNSRPILAAVYKTSGIKIKVISGGYEAELIRKAVQNAIGLNNEHCLLIDIGGGSVELTHLQRKTLFYSQSFKWGMVRLLKESAKKKKRSQYLISTRLKKFAPQMPKGKFDLAIGTGGNLDAIARLKLVHLKKGPNTAVTIDELSEIYKNFIETKPSVRALKFKLRPDRVDVIEPAMFLTLSLMKKYKINKIKIPGIGLKEGAILAHL